MHVVRHNHNHIWNHVRMGVMEKSWNSVFWFLWEPCYAYGLGLGRVRWSLPHCFVWDACRKWSWFGNDLNHGGDTLWLESLALLHISYFNNVPRTWWETVRHKAFEGKATGSSSAQIILESKQNRFSAQQIWQIKCTTDLVTLDYLLVTNHLQYLALWD